MYEKLFNQLDKIHSIAIKGPVNDEPLKGLYPEIVMKIASQNKCKRQALLKTAQSLAILSCDKGNK